MAKEKLSKDEINQAYQEILGRNADPTGLESYAGFSKGDLEKSLKKSKEFKDSGRTKQDVERARMQNDLKTQSNITTTKGVEKGSYFTLAEGVKPDDRAYEVGELPDGTKLYVKGDKQTSGLLGKLGISDDFIRGAGRIAGQVGSFMPGGAFVGDEAAAIAGGTRGAAAYRTGLEDIYGKKGAKVMDDAGDIGTKVAAGVLAAPTFGGSLAAEQALDVAARASQNQKIDWGKEGIRLGVNLLSANVGNLSQAAGIAKDSWTAAGAAGGIQAAGGFAMGDDIEDIALNAAIASLSTKMSGPGEQPAAKAADPAVAMTPGNTPTAAVPESGAVSPGGATPADSVKPGEWDSSWLGPEQKTFAEYQTAKAPAAGSSDFVVRNADGSVTPISKDVADSFAKGELALPEGAKMQRAIGTPESRTYLDVVQKKPDASMQDIINAGKKTELSGIKWMAGTSIATILASGGIQYMGIQKQDKLARDQMRQEKELFYAGLDAEAGYMNSSFAASSAGEAAGPDTGGAPAAIWN